MPLQTAIEQVLRTSSSTSRLVEQMFKPASTAVVLANLRGLDRATPPTLRLIEQTNAARLSKAILGESALTSWRVALQANSRLEELSKALAAAHRLTLPPSVLADLARTGRRRCDSPRGRSNRTQASDCSVSSAAARLVCGATSSSACQCRQGRDSCVSQRSPGMARLVFSGEMC
jgi:hypothetical protein